MEQAEGQSWCNEWDAIQIKLEMRDPSFIPLPAHVLEIVDAAGEKVNVVYSVPYVADGFLP